MKEGEILRKALDTCGKSIIEVANLSGISRAQIYILCERDKIDKEYKEKLSKVGIYLGDMSKPKDIDIHENVQLTLNFQKQLIEEKERSIKILEDALESAKREIKNYMETISIYQNTHELISIPKRK